MSQLMMTRLMCVLVVLLVAAPWSIMATVPIQFDMQVLMNTSVFTIAPVENATDASAVVLGRYLEAIPVIGQSRLTLDTVTNPAASDRDYFYALGLAEGYLTAKRVIQQLYNVVWSKPRQSGYVYTFLAAQYNYMRENSQARWREDSYWFQVGLSLARLDGMMDGLRSRQKAEMEKIERNGPPTEMDDSMWPFYPVSYMALYELNSNSELGEISGSLAKDGESVYTGRFTDHSEGVPPSAGMSPSEADDLRLPEFQMAEQTKCSALVKLVHPNDPNRVDLITAHNTWTSYSEMLRIYKTLSFLHVQHPSFTNRRFAMASYPGYLSSTDDWVSLGDSELLVTETTNECLSKARLREYVVPASVTTVVRSIVASVMAGSGSEWFDVFSRGNSGTYNNQWILVDYGKFRAWKLDGARQENVPEDVLWIGEQAPGLVLYHDMTAHLWTETYWASYNRPYFAEIANVSGYTAASALHGEWFHHQNCPRARMFAALHSAVTDIDSMKAIMSLNRFDVMNATYLHTHSCPKNQIAGRYDLDAGLDVNSLDYKKCGPVMAYGALDCKITDTSLMQADAVLMVSAPLWNNSVPAFDWTELPGEAQTAHWGQPDSWNFSFVKWTADQVGWVDDAVAIDEQAMELPEYVIGIDVPHRRHRHRAGWPKPAKVKLPEDTHDAVVS